MEGNLDSCNEYAKELDEAAAILEAIHPVGKVKAIGRREVVAALKELFHTEVGRDHVRKWMSNQEPVF